MKKSTIVVVIVAVIMAIVGAGLFVGGMVAAGGTEAAIDVLDEFELYINEDGLNFNYSDRNHRKETTVSEEKNTFAMEDVESLYLELNEAEVEIGGSSNREISIQTDGDYEIYVRNKILYIEPKGKQKAHQMLIEIPNVQVPGEFIFEDAEIHAGAGTIDISQISSKEFDLEVGAGQVTINQLVAEQADFDIGAGEVIVEYGNVNDCETNVELGNFEYTGMILKHGDVECNMGNAVYHLEREIEDYNFEIACGAGNVDVGNESFSGLGREKYINHHVQESFDIECNVGNVSIDSMN